MQLNRTKNELDREARNNENQNWEKIEKIADDISGKAFDQLVDKAKLIWKEPVNTFEDLPSNAEIGETRQIRSTGKVYRWDGTDWNEIQQIDAGPVNEVDTRLTNKITTVQNEIENASVSHTGTNYNNLKERLDKEHQEVTSQLAQIQDEKASKKELEQNKTELQTYIDNQLNQLDGLSLRGAFATLEELNTAFPNGTEGIYVVQDDGHWYYWDGANWSDGGIYQAMPWDAFMTVEGQEWVI